MLRDQGNAAPLSQLLCAAAADIERLEVERDEYKQRWLDTVAKEAEVVRHAYRRGYETGYCTGRRGGTRVTNPERRARGELGALLNA